MHVVAGRTASGAGLPRLPPVLPTGDRRLDRLAGLVNRLDMQVGDERRHGGLVGVVGEPLQVEGITFLPPPAVRTHGVEYRRERGYGPGEGIGLVWRRA